jgi:hypothetical protein
MPRLNRTEFFARRTRLQTSWATGGHLLRRLTAEQQWALQDFYLFGHDLSEPDVIARRDAAIAAQPDLAKVAGLAYRSFSTLDAQARQRAEAAIAPLRAQPQLAPAPRRRRRGPSRLIAWSDPDRPTDMKLLAETLVELAKQREAQDKNRTADTETPPPDDPKQVKSPRAGRTDGLEPPAGNRNKKQENPRSEDLGFPRNPAAATTTTTNETANVPIETNESS